MDKCPIRIAMFIAVDLAQEEKERLKKSGIV